MLLARLDPRRPLLADRSPHSVYRWALGMGWDTAAAGRWAAWNAGLAPTDEHGFSPWTLPQIDALLFLRELVCTGRLAGDTEA